MHCRLEKSRWWEKGSLSCSWGMQPTTEIIGIKFEVIQLIIFGTGILNLGNPKSEILYFLVMHFFLSWACSVRPSIGPFRLSQPLTSYLLQSHTQVICIFICLCTGSSTLNVCLDAVPLPQWSGWLFTISPATEISWGPSSCNEEIYKLGIIAESRGVQILVHLQIKVQILGIYVPRFRFTGSRSCPGICIYNPPSRQFWWMQSVDQALRCTVFYVTSEQRRQNIWPGCWLTNWLSR